MEVEGPLVSQEPIHWNSLSNVLQTDGVLDLRVIIRVVPFGGKVQEHWSHWTPIHSSRPNDLHAFQHYHNQRQA